MAKRTLHSLAVLGLAFVSAHDARAATFTWIGDSYGHLTAVSDDGSVTVGSFSSTDHQAFRWTAETGMVRLGSLPGGDGSSEASAVSADGSVVVGSSGSSENAFGRVSEAFRWTEETGMIGLGNLPGETRTGSAAAAVSDDGNVIVGSEYTAAGWETFRWTAETGMVGLGSGRANAISADGTIVAGQDGDGNAFRWMAETGMVGLGSLLPGGDRSSEANAMSADGSVIVGSVDRGFGAEPFRWTAETGMVGLGDLGECKFNLLVDGVVGEYKYKGWATDVSADGNIVIGQGCSNGFPAAFIWDAENGIRDLEQVLINDFGLDLTGWSGFSYAEGISADGTVIVGYDGAITQGAWIAIIPEPSALILAVVGLLGLVGYRRPR